MAAKRLGDDWASAMDEPIFGLEKIIAKYQGSIYAEPMSQMANKTY